MNPRNFDSDYLLSTNLREIAHNTRVFTKPTTTLPKPASTELDAIWFGDALPLAPRPFHDALAKKDRLVTFLGPKFDDQDLICITKSSKKKCRERTIARTRAPVITRRYKWLRRMPTASTAE